MSTMFAGRTTFARDKEVKMEIYVTEDELKDIIEIFGETNIQIIKDGDKVLIKRKEKEDDG